MYILIVFVPTAPPHIHGLHLFLCVTCQPSEWPAGVWVWIILQKTVHLNISKTPSSPQDCIGKQQAFFFFFFISFGLFTILCLEKKKTITTAFISDAYNQQNAYWVYMVAVCIRGCLFEKRLKTIVGVQCNITVFCYDKVRFIIGKLKKQQHIFIFTNLNLV